MSGVLWDDSSKNALAESYISQIGTKITLASAIQNALYMLSKEKLTAFFNLPNFGFQNSQVNKL